MSFHIAASTIPVSGAGLMYRISANSSLVDIKAAVPPASGLKKGETPQQYVARTIDLDLGDF